MLPINDLVNGTLDDAVGYLAGRAAAVRTGGRTLAEKQASSASDVLSSLGDSVKTNPILGKALLGGGLGAAVGAGSEMFAPENKKRKGGMLSKALTGGMAGMALGGGLGAAQHFWPGMGGGEGGGMGGGGGGHGGKDVGTFTQNGQKFKVDPKLLKDNPKMLEQVQELSSPGPLHESLPGKAVKFIMNNPLAPTTTPYILPTAAADAALHSSSLRLGDRNWLHAPGKAIEGLGGLFNRGGGGANWLQRAGQAVTNKGTQLRDAGWFPGMIDARNSRNVDDFNRGLDKALEGNHTLIGGKDRNQIGKILESARKNEDIRFTEGGVSRTQKGHDFLRDFAKNRRSTGDRQVFMPEVTEAPHPDFHNDPAAHGRAVKAEAGAGGRASFEPIMHRRTTYNQHTLPKSIGDEIALLGAGERAMHNAGNPALKASLASSEASHMFRGGPMGGDRVLEGAVFKGGRGLKRLGLYAGIPAAEWAIRSYTRDLGKSRQLSELLDEARAKGHIRPVE